MVTKYLPLALIVLSVATYHVCQKLLSKHQEPWAALAGIYFVAFVVTLLMSAPWKAPAAWVQSLWAIGPAGVLLGLACIGIELGVLVAYKNGWNSNTLLTHTSVASCLAVAVLGTLIFKEELTPTAVLGLVISATGIGLIHWR